MLKDVLIRSTGRYLPERIVPNSYFESYLDTSDQWITERTGIKERRFAAEGEQVSDMALHAAKDCLGRAGVSPEELGVIIIGTVTPDTVFPATANWLQGKLGAKHAWTFDVNAGCSGYVYALNVAWNMLRAGQHRYALVIGAEKMTALCDMQNRDHCVLFGDGAGALLLEAVEPADNPEGYGIRDFYLLSDGSRAEILHQPAGGSNLPPTHETVDQRLHYIHMDGQAVFKGAVRHMYESVMKVLGKVDVAPADVDWFIAHQANERIIISTQQRLKVPLERVYINVGKYGNTTAATIPICLDELREDGKLAPGQNIVLFTFGTGFTWGSSFLVWGGSA